MDWWSWQHPKDALALPWPCVLCVLGWSLQSAPPTRVPAGSSAATSASRGTSGCSAWRGSGPRRRAGASAPKSPWKQDSSSLNIWEKLLASKNSGRNLDQKSGVGIFSGRSKGEDEEKKNSGVFFLVNQVFVSPVERGWLMFEICLICPVKAKSEMRTLQDLWCTR